MEADFSGYVTKAGVRCTDGRTIMPDAFKHQDKEQVPLVYMHGHTEIENVLGHVQLEHRPDGVYGYGFFNKTAKAAHAHEAVEHKDIKAMSIWAGQLIQTGKMVVHGAIKEVSLVLSGANPGALIDNVVIRHSDDGSDDETLPDEAIITSGEEFEIIHSDTEGDKPEEKNEKKDEDKDDVTHAEGDDDESLEDVYESMNEKQQGLLHFMLAEAIEGAESLKQDDVDDDKSDDTNTNDKEGAEMKHENVFEKGNDAPSHEISHADMKGIVEEGDRLGSMKKAVKEYALAHGITDIETLFPDAKAVTDTPEWISRRVEWVADLLGKVRKSPFAKIKTLSADLTYDEARAKGYVKGTLKKEEFFGVSARTTEPKTIYKKQALDRDDMIDITDFDVVAWLKAEMRLMLDEELARAILVGDGRDPSDEDKISETNIRPIATDHELYTTVVNVNVGDASSTMNEVVDAVITNRWKLRGSGSPTFFTTEYWLGRFMLLRDNQGHRMYKTLADLAAELRVSNIVAVEAMMSDQSIVGIIVNPSDYVLGANRGGQVTMFDDFDIDYNKQKYLIETRVSGALVKVKSAMVIMSTDSDSVLATPTEPAFVAATGVVTIPTVTGVVYKDAEGDTIPAGAMAAIAAGASVTIYSVPASGYHFASSDDDSWTFTRDEA